MKIALKVYIFEEPFKHFYKIYVIGNQNVKISRGGGDFSTFFFSNLKENVSLKIKIKLCKYRVTDKQKKNTSFLKSIWYIDILI